MKPTAPLALSRRGMLCSVIAGTSILPALLSQMLAEESGQAPDQLAPRLTHFPAKAEAGDFSVHGWRSFTR